MRRCRFRLEATRLPALISLNGGAGMESTCRGDRVTARSMVLGASARLTRNDDASAWISA
jgi:hypothetical protein